MKIKNKVGSISEKLNPRHNPREHSNFYNCDNERCPSTQFLQTQKNQLIELQELLERFCNKLVVFGFNGAKNDLNLFKCNLLLILNN